MDPVTAGLGHLGYLECGVFRVLGFRVFGYLGFRVFGNLGFRVLGVRV